MAIKEVKREWDECQLDYVKEFILHCEDDVANLPKCCIGSTAIVSATGNVYVCGQGKVWKLREEAMQEGPGAAAGGVTSWNDLTDKPFDDVETVFFEEQEIAFDEYGEAAITVTAVPIVGDNVTVKWDGVEYVRQATDFNGAAFVGNAVFVGGDDTGEPFAVIMVSPEMVFVVSINRKASAALKISGVTVNKLDQKYVDAVTVFYVADSPYTDAYIYSDIAMSTKATAGELKSAFKCGAVVFSIQDIYFRQATTFYINGQYGAVDFLTYNYEDDRSGVIVYYTAEYVPPETTGE